MKYEKKIATPPPLPGDFRCKKKPIKNSFQVQKQINKKMFYVKSKQNYISKHAIKDPK